MYTKIVQSGTLIERYVYEKEPIPFQKRRKSKKPQRAYRRRRSADILRTRNTFFRLVRANLRIDAPPSFLTITMRDITTIGEGWRAFTLFAQRVRGKKPAFAFVAVPEFQERGAVHFHCLVWGLEDQACYYSDQFYYDKTGKRKRKHICPEAYFCERKSRRIAQWWGHGFVDLFATDGSPKLATYLAKYMSKALLDNRLAGKKSFSASRNLVRVVSVRGGAAIDTIERMLEGQEIGPEGFTGMVGEPLTPTETREYNTTWLGRCQYSQFNLE